MPSTEIYTLPLHDALPIYGRRVRENRREPVFLIWNQGRFFIASQEKSRLLGSQPQEDFPLIQEAREPDEQRHAHRRDDEFTATVGDVRVKKTYHRGAVETPGQFLKTQAAKKIAGQIQRDRVHPDPDERLAPRRYFFHIHDPVKRAEQHPDRKSTRL